MSNTILKLKYITRIDCLPCQGGKFVLKRLKEKFNFEVDLISINASNRTEIFEKFNITREMIPAVFIDHKLVCHGKISESVVKEAIEDWYRNIKI